MDQSKMIGVMLDCSRNAVITVDAAKKYASIIKKMGYNTLMLYTEDTYEVDGHPYFGHLRGRYSKEELKELDSYCNSIGVELVPCIQTLAHLNCMFKWTKAYRSINDCDDILLCGEEKTYELIDAMFSTIKECFTSKKIHIGMDEAYRVGTGAYQQAHGIEDRFDIINRHLHRVCDIAANYGLEPMIWSDMFRKLALNITNQYLDVDPSQILEKSKLPDNVSLVYWDYYSDDYDRYTMMIKTNQMFGRRVYFAGGAWTWSGFCPENAFSIKNTEVALRACRDNGVEDFFLTVWGDDGGECSFFSILPTLMFAAEAWRGNTDMDSIKKKFYDIVGCEFDSFMLFDKLNQLGGAHRRNPSKYLLYNDLFMGISDCLCENDPAEFYKDLADDIKVVKEKGEFCHLFDAYEALARLLSVKAHLGVKTREAYKARDIEALKSIISEYDSVIEKMDVFHTVYQKAWFAEKKPHGFDIQDHRMGGVIMRTKSCKERLQLLVDGVIDKIDELDEPVLALMCDARHWGRSITANVITH